MSAAVSALPAAPAVKRGPLFATTALAAGGIVLSAGATQYVAHRLGYHPAVVDIA